MAYCNSQGESTLKPASVQLHLQFIRWHSGTIQNLHSTTSLLDMNRKKEISSSKHTKEIFVFSDKEQIQ